MGDGVSVYFVDWLYKDVLLTNLFMCKWNILFIGQIGFKLWTF